ncbi:hypothetical protein LEC33_23445 [Salmonella enterica]|nr:hypothetical protein [Salmonella enterica]MDJ7048186.1 hypothetical protein [Salmonella enterica]MDJ7338459.1 hypothetical protein [Salmonella enterica]
MVVTAATAGQVITVVMVVKVEMPAVTPVEVMEDTVETAVKAETMGETGVKAEMVVQEIIHQVVMVAKGAEEEMLPEGTEEMEVREETVITRPEGMALQVEMVVTIRETTTGIIQGMLTVPETETEAVMANTNHKIKTEIHYA